MLGKDSVWCINLLNMKNEMSFSTGIIALIAILFHYVSLPVSFLNLWKSSSERRHGTLLPCDTFKVEDVWVRNFPMLLTNSAFRMVDINGDGVDDIILGFATGEWSSSPNRNLSLNDELWLGDY